MGRSAEQAAKNESTFRGLNESLQRKADELGLGDERTPYLCECEDERCTQVVLLRRDQYQEVRSHPRRFVVAPGHEFGRHVLLQDGADFAVIEKQGREGELVEQHDRRSAG